MPAVRGNRKHGETDDASEPVKIGGVATASTASQVSEGDRVQASFDLEGRLRTVVAGGGGGSATEYTEGDADASITGTAVMWEDAADTLRAVSAAKPLPISVAVLPLPTGAATLAEQQTQTASLSVLDDWDSNDRAKVSPISGQDGVAGGAGVTTALTQRVVVATDQSVIPISAASLPLPTGAATLAEQQTQTASLSVLDDWDESDRAKANIIVGQAGVAGGAGAVGANTQRVVIVTDQTTIPVDGSAVTQPISAASLPLPTGASTLAEQQTQTASLSVLDDWDESDRAKVNIVVGQAGITAGSGTIAANTPRVVLATDQPVIPVSDNGGSLTVDGSVTANAGTNLNTSALALEAGGNLAGAATSLAVLDDWDESDRAKVNPIVGQAGVQGGSGASTALTQRVAIATDANTVAHVTTTSGAVAGSIVSTSAVLLKASNASRRSIMVSNNGVGNLFIGGTSGVTASGSAMGILVKPGGVYTDAGPGLWTGDVYGIYDATASSQNVACWERT